MSKEHVIHITSGVAALSSLSLISLYLLSKQGNAYPGDTEGWVELAITLVLVPTFSCIKFRHNKFGAIISPAIIVIVGFLCFGLLVDGAHISVAAFFIIYALVVQILFYFVLKKLWSVSCQNS